MRRKNFVVIGAALVALLVAGGLFASNMGFKLNRVTTGPGAGSASGFNYIALPYNQQTNLLDAEDLRNDIGAVNVVRVSRFLATSDSFESYDGTNPATNFTLTPAAGYVIQNSNNVNYIIVGSHDPGLVVNFDAPGTNGSASGFNYFSPPYHTTATNADELIDEINAAAGTSAVVRVSRFLEATDTFESYDGTNPATNFTLAPGVSYVVQVSSDVSYVPSHY